MVGNVAVYLLSGLGAQGIVVAGHEAVLINKGDVPKGHVADDVMLHHFHLVLPVMDDGGKWQVPSIPDVPSPTRSLSQMATTAQERFM